MRILITNDDGVRAPGIAALARAVAGLGHELLVVAPLEDFSGSSAAVGPVHSRDGVDYESCPIEGLKEVPAFGIDGPPALAVILACVGGFGRRPDIVLSGINHGINVGRSAMHSGTVGAALTGAHFGLRCMAVSIRWAEDPLWETPATLAAGLLPVVCAAPGGTALNLNVPNSELSELKGVRRGRLSRGGIIRSAIHDSGRDGFPHVSLPAASTGTIRLDLAGSSNRPVDLEADTDAGLLARGFASITPLVGVREDAEDKADVVQNALNRLYELDGLGPGVLLDGVVEMGPQEIAAQ